MLISYTHEFIFIHVAKVAGLSIKSALEGYSQELDKFKLKRPPKTLNGKPNPMYEMWEAFIMHVTAKEAKKELPEEIYNNFYKFAFVRNPWDWQVSMYHFILKEKTHVSYELVRSMKGFDEYLAWVIEKPEKNAYPKGATKSQREMIVDQDGKIMVDFVGKYENLAQDFQHVCRTINIDASLPSINKSAHKDYRSYYNDRTRELVAEHFKEDIELFGYTFDG
uniref:Sulfotransferase family protein n=1 Tax=Candidatus Kentrum sp. FM TaxID=2126340 RepID=A0A450T7Y8_9GAMM|nr:MAG: Sulfotransferase family protein [Candidatus Kentron sp. FM]VFJ64271.1 MAG: Sulfotransferase family protein [Candidatus Kentron sp. FM]VFK13983.1 MAG: Sulfotransferase family protein [Candidatus Kentron sp. FM]